MMKGFGYYFDIGLIERGSVGSALAYCMAGPSSNPGSAPQGGFSLWAKQAMKKRREASANGYDWMYCMNVIMNVWKRQINTKSGSCHQTFICLVLMLLWLYKILVLYIWTAMTTVFEHFYGMGDGYGLSCGVGNGNGYGYDYGYGYGFG